MTVDPHAWIAGRRDFFARGSGRRVLVARAPGRLDVMGGIADYSGSLVLELPLAVATWVAAQARRRPDAIVIESEAARKATPPTRQHPARRLAAVRAARLRPRARPADRRSDAGLERVRRGRAGRAASPSTGGRCGTARGVLVRSEVPIGKGVSSSAALDVAAFEALAALAGVAVDDRQLALARAEGREPRGRRAVRRDGPDDGRVWPPRSPARARCASRPRWSATCRCRRRLEVHGIDSGIRHAVSGADYGTVRAAAFMGYRIVAAAAGLTARATGEGRVAIDDAMFDGYLANVAAGGWRRRFRDAVPERMTAPSSSRATRDRPTR